MDNIEKLMLHAGDSYKTSIREMTGYIFRENKVPHFAKATGCSGQTEYLVRLNAMIQYILEQHMQNFNDLCSVLSSLSQIDLAVLFETTMLYLNANRFSYGQSKIRVDIYRKSECISAHDRILFELEILTNKITGLLSRKDLKERLDKLLTA